MTEALSSLVLNIASFSLTRIHVVRNTVELRDS